MATTKPNLTRTWAEGAPGANVVDPDITTPGKFDAGWLAEVPPFEHFNFLQKLFTQGLAHNNEQGINVWDTNTTYPINGLAKGADGITYMALLEQSGNDPVGDGGTNWEGWLEKNIRHYTLAEAVALTLVLENEIVQITDRSNAQYQYLTGQVPNTHDIVVADATDLDLVLIVPQIPIPEHIGAVGDGIADDFIKLTAFIAYCKSKKIKGFGKSNSTYLIGSPLNFDDISADFSASIIKLKDAFSIIADTVAISSGDGSAIFTTTPRTFKIVINGNRDNQTVDLIAFNLNGDQAALSDYLIKVFEFTRGVLVDGDCERNNVIIHGSKGGTLLEENDLNAGSPDDNVYRLFGANCEKWYKGQGQISSKVNFAVEASTDVGDWALEVLTGKVVTLSGEIRGINGKGMRLNDLGSTGTVIYDDLSIIQVVGGVAVEMQDMHAVIGNLYLENFDDEGVVIDSVINLGGLYLNLKDNVGVKTPLTIQDRGFGGNCEETSFSCSLHCAGDANGDALIVDNMLNSTIFIDKINGNILADTGCSRVMCYVDSAFVDADRSAINNANSGRFGLTIRGQVASTQVLNAVSLWAFNGVIIEQVESSMDRYEWKSTGWTRSVTARVSSTSLVDISDTINTKFKVRGQHVYNTSVDRPVWPEGGLAADVWRFADGSLAYTPV